MLFSVRKVHWPLPLNALIQCVFLFQKVYAFSEQGSYIEQISCKMTIFWTVFGDFGSKIPSSCFDG